MFCGQLPVWSRTVKRSFFCYEYNFITLPYECLVLPDFLGQLLSFNEFIHAFVILTHGVLALDKSIEFIVAFL